MGYEQLNGNVPIVQLGGVNKQTGKPNPKEVEGYLVRVEEKQDRFNPGKQQKFYVLETKAGQVGLFGKTDIDRKMKTAELGAMTKIATTNETKDTGKGFPMKVWYVAQDLSNTKGYGSTESADEYEPQDENTGDQDDYTPSPQDRVKQLLKSRTAGK